MSIEDKAVRTAILSPLLIYFNDAVRRQFGQLPILAYGSDLHQRLDTGRTLDRSTAALAAA